MELEDCGFDLLLDVITTSDSTVAFQNIDILIGLGAFPRGPGNPTAAPRTHNAKKGEIRVIMMVRRRHWGWQRRTLAPSRASHAWASACVCTCRSGPSLIFLCAGHAGMERKDLLAKNVNIFKVSPPHARGIIIPACTPCRSTLAWARAPARANALSKRGVCATCHKRKFRSHSPSREYRHLRTVCLFSFSCALSLSLSPSLLRSLARARALALSPSLALPLSLPPSHLLGRRRAAC